eukprot:943720-Rhodomonas_salina.1
MISNNLGSLLENSFNHHMKTQERPYDAMLEEFKWLQSLPSQSQQVIEDILPPGGSGTTDKFRSDSMVRSCTLTCAGEASGGKFQADDVVRA